MSPPSLTIFKGFPRHLGTIFSLHATSALRLLPRFFIVHFSFHNGVSTSLSFIFILFYFIFLLFFSYTKISSPSGTRTAQTSGLIGPFGFFALALVSPVQKQHVLSFLFFITTVILNEILHMFLLLFYGNYSTLK